MNPILTCHIISEFFHNKTSHPLASPKSAQDMQTPQPPCPGTIPSLAVDRHQLHGPQGTHCTHKQSDTSSETPWTFNQLPQDLAPTPLTSRSTPTAGHSRPQSSCARNWCYPTNRPTLDPKALAPPLPILDPSFTHQWASTNPGTTCLSGSPQLAAL